MSGNESVDVEEIFFMSFKKAVDIFGEWAKEGKDIGMQKNHAAAVNEMLEYALGERANIGKNFSFLDVGCGNGWVVGSVAEYKLCERSVGIDGAKKMIDKAKWYLDSDDEVAILNNNWGLPAVHTSGNKTDPRKKIEYILADINSFYSNDKYDVIHSMEVLYYLDNPSEIVKRISDSWLSEEGRLIVGIDHYYENTDSHSWQKKVGTRMLMLSEAEWINIFEMAGLHEVRSWRSGKDKNWAGTLVITGKK